MIRDDAGWMLPAFHILAILAVMAAFSAPSLPLRAQGLDAEGAIDTIIDAPVETGVASVGDEEERIAAAIDHSREAAEEVRRRFALDKVEIVFLPDLDEQDSPLAARLAENREALDELRTAIEGSAMFYHAVDSRSILLRNVVAVEFGSGGDVTIFAAGDDPAR